MVLCALCGNAYCYKDNNNKKQAGAELCQAQIKLGLAKFGVIFHLPKELRSSSVLFKVEVVFHLPKKFKFPSICLKVEDVFHLMSSFILGEIEVVFHVGEN